MAREMTVAPPHQHIVVCTDGSPAMAATVRGAQLLARTAGAQLHLLYVAQTDSPHYVSVWHDIEIDALRLDAKSAMISLAPEDKWHIAQPLARYLSDLPNALACISAHGRHAVNRALLGSVTSELLAETSQPTLVFGPHAVYPDKITRVVACTDGSDLSEEIMPAAAGLARELGVPLWLVEVADTSALPSNSDLVESTTVEGLSVRLGDVGVFASWDVLHGPKPSASIVDFARDAPGTVIALATHGRGALADAVLGGVAQGVVRDSTGPVLLMRPSGLDQTPHS